MENRTVAATDITSRLVELLERVKAGEHITLTEKGRPVATLIPAEGERHRTASEAIKGIRELSEGMTLGGLSPRELIEEGRR